jgi:protein-S-isoprenylcysteine O-methyltransferase Ste14
VDWLINATQREYGRMRRVGALLLGQALFLILYPLFMVLAGSLSDRWLGIPRFGHALLNPVVAMVFIVPGLVLVEWTVGVQFFQGLGTPLPVVATRRLIISGPYRYSRNPMAAGTTMFYLGIAAWIGSVSAAVLASFYPLAITAYTKLVEERELEKRFGCEYVEYKKRTPFVLPRWPGRH